MRWFVEISSIGKGGAKETLCVDAPNWQRALAETRRRRGGAEGMAGLSVEISTEGCVAVDPAGRARYAVLRAPDDAPLSVPPPAAAAGDAAAVPAPSAAAPPGAERTSSAPVSAPPRSRQLRRKRGQTVAFGSSGAAEFRPAQPPEPAAPSPVPAPAAAARPAVQAEIGPATQRDRSGLRAAVPAAAPAPAGPAAPATVKGRAAPAAEVARAAAPGPELVLLAARDTDPTPGSPLTYRERVFGTRRELTAAELESLARTRFEELRQSLREAPKGRMINIAIFDHVFQDKPQRPPVMTLSWRDWRAEEPELTFFPYGPKPAATAAAAEAIRASTPPPGRSSTGSGRPPSGSGGAAPAPGAGPAPAGAAPGGPAGAAAPASQRRPSGRDRASSIPPRPSVPPGVRLGGDELLTDLFESISDLHFLPDALEGADFVLALALEKLPSEVGMVSLFDIDTRDYVIVRQTGGARSGLLLRLGESSPLARRAMRTGRAVVIAEASREPSLVDGRWKEIGTVPRSLICAPVQAAGRYLGLIELCNPHDGRIYKESDGHALSYIGDQYAQFVAERSVIVDPDQVLENA
ncbi:MAG: GAF domain-containing protein [Deltaproteobacteria bacterium]|nr:GAF domain-containing protein [Deltaproteobacteria bacterium]